MSWDDLEDAPDRRDVLQRQVDTNRRLLRVLGSEDGKDVMAWLREMYVEPPVATPGADPSFAYHREGQRSVVLDLEARLRRALHE